MSELTWIVPGRRAAITSQIDYSSLIQAWIMELQACKKSLMRWYNLNNSSFESGIEMVKFWHQSFFHIDNDLFIHAVRDGEVTIDHPPFDFKVRLWRGPLRVLLENEHAESLIGKKWYDANQIFSLATTPWPDATSEKPQAPRLATVNGQVMNSDAAFLTGDVVEFPLWRMLGGCGLKQYGNKNTFDDIMKFNPHGSYLLGNSVISASGDSTIPDNAPLHDNHLAMRFQNILGIFRGGFYHLNEKVYADKYYNNGKATSVEASCPETTEEIANQGKTGPIKHHTVYARGMMYAAVINSPRWSSYGDKSLKDSYRLFTSGWCHDVKKFDPPRCMPTRESLDLLPKHQPMTPGGVCSDTLLWLTNYMICTDKKKWSTGKGSVSGTVTNEGYPIYDYYNRIPAKDIEKWAPEFTREEKIKNLEVLYSELNALYDLIYGETALWNVLFNTIVASAPNVSDLIPNKRLKKLQELAPKTKPNSFMQTLYYAIKSKDTKPDGRKALIDLHKSIAFNIAQWAASMDRLIEKKYWMMFSSYGPNSGDLEPYLTNMREVAYDETKGYKDRHGMNDAYKIRFKLRSKIKALKKLRDNTDKIKSSRGGEVDLTKKLSDINVVAVSGHEWGIVRVKPLRQLLEEEKLPTTGYIAAFEPLSGIDCCPATASPEGQFYVYEESGSALRKKVEDINGSKKHSLMGCTPFNWYKVSENRFSISVNGSQVYFNAMGGTTRSKPLKSITMLRPPKNSEHKTILDSLHNTPTQTYLPIFIHPHLEHWKSDTGKRAFSRFVTNGNDLYSSRAVPFPSLNEWQGVLPNAEDIYVMLDKLKNKGVRS